MGPWLAYTCQHTCKHGKSRGNTIAARLRESADLGLLQDLFSSKFPGEGGALGRWVMLGDPWVTPGEPRVQWKDYRYRRAERLPGISEARAGAGVKRR